MTSQSKINHIRQALLKWYDIHSRHLPWRSRRRETPNPYHIWLSEIMLQQTTVATVIPYFEKFKRQWPGFEDFSEISLEDLRVAWQGLGYYSRARNMHRCAQIVVQDHKGVFPSNSTELLLLPGIGPYTAAAIAAIAFDEAIVPVDGNILRVVARLFAIEKPLPASKPDLSELAAYFASPERPGDFAQALMDLGATVCTPRKPSCLICPLQSDCLAYKNGQPERLPLKESKLPRPKKYAEVYFYMNENQEIALRRRPEQGLLGGFIEIPSSVWEIGELDHSQYKAVVRHIFTHIDLSMGIIMMDARVHIPPSECFWVQIDDLAKYPLPTLTHKIIKAALGLRDNNS